MTANAGLSIAASDKGNFYLHRMIQSSFSSVLSTESATQQCSDRLLAKIDAKCILPKNERKPTTSQISFYFLKTETFLSF